MDWLQQHHTYVGHLERLRRQLAGELAEAERQLCAERSRLVEASRAYKVVQKLRDKHVRAHVEKERRQEACELDDAGLEGFRRKPASISDDAPGRAMMLPLSRSTISDGEAMVEAGP